MFIVSVVQWYGSPQDLPQMFGDTDTDVWFFWYHVLFGLVWQPSRLATAAAILCTPLNTSIIIYSYFTNLYHAIVAAVQ